MRKLLIGFALASGCAAQGVGGGGLPGTWELSQSTATARYVFDASAQFTFDGGAPGARVQYSGAWFADGATLTLSFDGRGTFDVPYAIDGAALTITDDPATVRAGTHADAVYTRQ